VTVLKASERVHASGRSVPAGDTRGTVTCRDLGYRRERSKALPPRAMSRARDGITWRLKIFAFVTGGDRCFLSSALRLADHQARHSELGGRRDARMRAFGRARVPLTPRASGQT